MNNMNKPNITINVASGIGYPPPPTAKPHNISVPGRLFQSHNLPLATKAQGHKEVPSIKACPVLDTGRGFRGVCNIFCTHILHSINLKNINNNVRNPSCPTAGFILMKEGQNLPTPA
jgi:hypothetical protein